MRYYEVNSINCGSNYYSIFDERLSCRKPSSERGVTHGTQYRQYSTFRHISGFTGFADLRISTENLNPTKSKQQLFGFFLIFQGGSMSNKILKIRHFTDFTRFYEDI